MIKNKITTNLRRLFNNSYLDNDNLIEPQKLPIIKRSKGAYVYDYDGNKYIDFSCNHGNIILGHANKKITPIVKNAISKGHSYDYPSKEYYQLFKTLKKHVDNLHKLAIYSSVDIAIEKIIQSFYQSTDDVFLIIKGGLIDNYFKSKRMFLEKINIISVDLNNYDQLEILIKKYNNNIKCFFLEPIILSNNIDILNENCYQLINQLRDKHDTIIVLDERLTAFRLVKVFNNTCLINPDITILGNEISDDFDCGMLLILNDKIKSLEINNHPYIYNILPITVANILLKNISNKSIANLNTVILSESAKYNSFSITTVGSIFNISFSSKINISEFYYRLLSEKIMFSKYFFPNGFISFEHNEYDIKNLFKIIDKIVNSLI